MRSFLTVLISMITAAGIAGAQNTSGKSTPWAIKPGDGRGKGNLIYDSTTERTYRFYNTSEYGVCIVVKPAKGEPRRVGLTAGSSTDVTGIQIGIQASPECDDSNMKPSSGTYEVVG